MLILTRRIGETIRISNDITVTVLGIQQGQIKLGVAAPKHVAVDREEIAIRKEQNPRNEVAHAAS
ncbi:carbon storage regulator CsrA [Pseudomonas abietaniphila]|jgi:carbon storage regulator